MYAICMLGNILCTQKCPACGGIMRNDERRGNCFCDCGVPASKGYKVRFGREITKRFKTYPEAARFLNGLRFKTDEGTYDRRDYQQDNPLAFRNQVARWMVIKKKQVGSETYRKYNRYVNKMIAIWGDRNIKTISSGDIEDFLYADTTAKSEKTRSDVRSIINHFFTWIADREDIKIPKIPKVTFDLGYRKITTLDTQQDILGEVYRIAPQEKIAFGIELLATYPKLRPDDLRRVTEGDIDGDIVTFHNPTKKKNQFKILRLLPEHVDRIEELRQKEPAALPQVPFFRHLNVRGATTGQPYGKDLFYKWWKNACKNLGVEGLDLYGGTRHTTTTAIARLAGREKAKSATCHDTNKAFLRYCQAEDETAFEMATLVKKKTDQRVTNIKTATRKAK